MACAGRIMRMPAILFKPLAMRTRIHWGKINPLSGFHWIRSSVEQALQEAIKDNKDQRS